MKALSAFRIEKGPRLASLLACMGCEAAAEPDLCSLRIE
jgi:hypothetical protein